MGRSSDTEIVSTLTGRIPLWGECYTYFLQKPIQGYGYGAFWTSQHIAEISAVQGWVIGSSHSVYFEQALQLGIVGLFSYIMVLKAALLKSVKLEKVTDNHRPMFFVLFFSFCFVHGFLESALAHHRFMMYLFLVGLMRLGFFKLPVRKSVSSFYYEQG